MQLLLLLALTLAMTVLLSEQGGPPKRRPPGDWPFTPQSSLGPRHGRSQGGLIDFAGLFLSIALLYG